MMALVDQVKLKTQLRWNRVHKFKAKVDMSIEVGPYQVKTAQTAEELMESFRLRHQVFHNEFRGVPGDGLDFDRFDYHFDHLIIVHKASGKVIGTYRLNCSMFSQESYTAQEFDLSALASHPGPWLELGRACIHREFRKGSVISLLWRGIAEYMNLSGSTLLFGCSSLKINNAREAALVSKFLDTTGHGSQEFHCRPTTKFTMADLEAWKQYFSGELNERQESEANDLIPSLLKSYLKLGAKVAGDPAFDEEFDCIDILTILKRSDLSNLLAEKFRIAR